MVIYKFEVIQGQESEFKEAWAKLTKAFMEHASSLGSRLHMDDDGDFFAYAQWPDEETFLKSKSRLPESAKELGPRMEAFCVSISILHKLNTTMDLLKRGLNICIIAPVGYRSADDHT